MRKKDKKALVMGIVFAILLCIGINSYGHSGRTDSSGGHKDNKNVSGLGSYHYHHGYGPHLHPNGVCAYSSNSKKTSNSNSSSSEKKNTSTNSPSSSKIKESTNQTILVTSVKINERLKQLEIEESTTLSATITPNDAKDKTITWKSNNEEIVVVDALGKVTAKNPGIAIITATSINNKTSTIEITVKENEKAKKGENNIVNTSTNTISTSTESNDDSTIIGTTILIAIIGGGSYLGYKKYKENKNQ